MMHSSHSTHQKFQGQHRGHSWSSIDKSPSTIPNLSKSGTWILFSISWLLTYLLQDRFDAAMLWLNGGETFSDMAAEAADGSLVRKVVGISLACIGVFLIVRLGKRRITLKGKLGALWAAFILLSSFSFVWSDDPSLTIKRVGFFLLLTVFAVGCALMPTKTMVLFLAGFTGLRLMVGVCVELIQGMFHPFQAGYRFAGTVHPNLQGASLALGTVLIVWSLWQRGLFRVRFRKLLIAAAILFFIFLLATSSRTSLVALLISLSVTASIVLAPRRPRQYGIVAALLGISLCGGYCFDLLVPDNSLRSSSALQRDRDDGDPSQLTGRLDLWKECAVFIEKRPWFGYGFDSFWNADHIDDISSQLQWPINQSHSSYIEELLNLGLVGACLYVSLLIGVLFLAVPQCWKGSEYHALVTAVTIFVLIHNFTESINILPTFPNFIFNMFLLRFALITTPSPTPINGDSLASGYSLLRTVRV